MNRKILVLSIPIALLFLGGWFVFRQYERVSEGENLPKGMETLSENPENTTPPVSEIDTSNWKTYRNEKCGFEIRYPDNIYEVESGGYISLISFVARSKDLKKKYGDIQVLCGDGEGGSLDEKEISKDLRVVSFGGNKIYFDESRKLCGAGVGYCPVPGEAFIFVGNKSFVVRRITFQEAKYPLPMEGNFVQFLASFKSL